MSCWGAARRRSGPRDSCAPVPRRFLSSARPAARAAAGAPGSGQCWHRTAGPSPLGRRADGGCPAVLTDRARRPASQTARRPRGGQGTPSFRDRSAARGAGRERSPGRARSRSHRRSPVGPPTRGCKDRIPGRDRRMPSVVAARARAPAAGARRAAKLAEPRRRRRRRRRSAPGSGHRRSRRRPPPAYHRPRKPPRRTGRRPASGSHPRQQTPARRRSDRGAGSALRSARMCAFVWFESPCLGADGYRSPRLAATLGSRERSLH